MVWSFWPLIYLESERHDTCLYFNDYVIWFFNLIRLILITLWMWPDRCHDFRMRIVPGLWLLVLLVHLKYLFILKIIKILLFSIISSVENSCLRMKNIHIFCFINIYDNFYFLLFCSARNYIEYMAWWMKKNCLKYLFIIWKTRIIFHSLLIILLEIDRIGLIVSYGLF